MAIRIVLSPAFRPPPGETRERVEQPAALVFVELRYAFTSET
jgi:hypothetical protein